MPVGYERSIEITDLWAELLHVQQKQNAFHHKLLHVQIHYVYLQLYRTLQSTRTQEKPTAVQDFIYMYTRLYLTCAKEKFRCTCTFISTSTYSTITTTITTPTTHTTTPTTSTATTATTTTTTTTTTPTTTSTT